MNRNKGITLIALIVTIIILLILAGISISLLVGENGILTKAKLAKEQSELSQNKENLIIDNTQRKMDEYISTRNNNGIIEVDNNWDMSKVSVFVSYEEIVTNKQVIIDNSNFKLIPIPKGFSYTEGTYNTGLVIKNDVDGNEFVWIPVDDISNIYDKENGNPQIYEFNKNILTKIDYSSTNYKEPKIVETDASNSVTLSVLQNDFQETMRSIEKYKGFYIGRYETTTENSKAVSKSEKTCGSNNWYYYYNLQKNLYLNSGIVKSGMILGCEYDQVMKFLKDIKNFNNPNEYYITYGKDVGNFSGVIKNTGSSQNYEVKNIYDLTGNQWEWTTEAYENNRVLRGAGYDNGSGVGTWANAVNRNVGNDPLRSYPGYNGAGARMQLYIVP